MTCNLETCEPYSEKKTLPLENVLQRVTVILWILFSFQGATAKYFNPSCKWFSSYSIVFETCYCEIKDIPDLNVKAKLDKIKNCENEHEFQEAVADFEERFNFGYMVFSPNFTDRDDLIKKVAHHFIYSQQFEELQDFLKGLSCNGVLEVLKKYPDDARPLFIAQKLCPDSLKNAFQGLIQRGLMEWLATTLSRWKKK